LLIEVVLAFAVLAALAFLVGARSVAGFAFGVAIALTAFHAALAGLTLLFA
jgi:hypothetical protein